MSICTELMIALDSREFRQLTERLKLPEVNQLLKTNDAGDLVNGLAMAFSRCVRLIFCDTQQLPPPLCPDIDEMIYECCRLLRNSCAIDKSFQLQIAQFPLDGGESLFQPITLVLMSNGRVSSRTQKMCWQMVANLGVQNIQTQREIWLKCMEPMIGHLSCVCCTGNGRECTMILYNLCLSEILTVNDVKRIVELLLECVCNRNDAHGLNDNDFHQLFMEHIITKYRTIVSIYDRIVPHEKRLHFIYYIADHMKSVRHDPISTTLLQFICKEFKKKSDCVLRTTAAAVNTIHPTEVVALLDAIAQASSDERYAHVLATDASLFINIGSLLRSVHELGKSQADGNIENIFAPIQKLTQLAPNSNENTTIERDISYQLKSTLIRTLANLVYKNKENQDLAREMEFIAAVLDSTTLDARNPLIKEWSILAIRNLCENNMENQQIISQLTKVGDSASDTVKEYNLDLGSLRINPNQP